MQSRYYNPEMGRFISADSYASTGQGVLGYNMYAYCKSNPVNYVDTTGSMCVAFKDLGGGYASGLSTAGFDPNGGFSSGGKKIDTSGLRSFSLLKESEKVSNGLKTAELITGGFDMYSHDDSGFNLLSFGLSIISLDISNENYTLSLFDLGNASASVGLGLVPYTSATVSLWSPSVTVPLSGTHITLGLHIGAIGIGYKFTSTEFTSSFANGLGFFIEITQ